MELQLQSRTLPGLDLREELEVTVEKAVECDTSLTVSSGTVGRLTTGGASPEISERWLQQKMMEALRAEPQAGAGWGRPPRPHPRHMGAQDEQSGQGWG